jgi:hypothetical protein
MNSNYFNCVDIRIPFHKCNCEFCHILFIFIQYKFIQYTRFNIMVFFFQKTTSPCDRITANNIRNTRLLLLLPLIFTSY